MSKLYAVDERGHPVLEQLLEPFFSSLLPALVARAEEIEIRASFSSNLVEMLYLKGGQTWLLTPARNFQPFIVSNRIRILAGMSVSTQHKKQCGTMRIFCLNSLLAINLEIDVGNDAELLCLKPAWPANKEPT